MISVLIGTYGDATAGHVAHRLVELACDRAYPSALAQGPLEVTLGHHDDGTLAGVRNDLAAQAKGDWLCFLDADDVLGSGYIDAMQKAIAALPPPDGRFLLVPALEQYDADANSLGPPSIPNWGRPLIDVNCAVIGTLIPRALFEHVGGFREWPAYEDWELVLRCVRAGAGLAPVRDAVYKATVAPATRNNQMHDVLQDTYWRIRAEHEHDPRVHLTHDWIHACATGW